MMNAPKYARGAAIPAFSTMNGMVNIPAIAGAMLVTDCISTPGSVITPFFRLALPGGLTPAEVVDSAMVLPP